MRLLSLLENMPYKISFESVKLEKISDGSDSDREKRGCLLIGAELSVLAY